MFNDISPEMVLIVFIISLVLQYAIIRMAVSHGNNTKHRDTHLKIQTNLLTYMARKAGVSEEDIQESFK